MRKLRVCCIFVFDIRKNTTEHTRGSALLSGDRAVGLQQTSELKSKAVKEVAETTATHRAIIYHGDRIQADRCTLLTKLMIS